jgi:hypothetical protein
MNILEKVNPVGMQAKRACKFLGTKGKKCPNTLVQNAVKK